MEIPLTKAEITVLLQEAQLAFRHEECATCECYLGFLTQLEIDADQDAQIYIQKNIPPREEIHACLGCDPCPPGVQFAEYLQNKSQIPFQKS